MSTLYTGPLSVEPIVDRLSASVSELQLISGAADLDAAERDKFPVTPASFVLLATERPQPVSSSTQRFRQTITATFFVVTAVRDRRIKDRGMAGWDLLQTIIAAQRAALLKWAHPQANRTGMRLGGTGRLLGYENALLGWQDSFQADYQIQIEKSV